MERIGYAETPSSVISLSANQLSLAFPQLTLY